MGSVTYALLVTISIAMTQSLAPAAQQLSAAQQTSSPASITLDEGSRDNQTTSIQQGFLDQKTSNLCSLQSPDALSSSRPNTKGATGTEGSLAYSPLSSRCKFH